MIHEDFYEAAIRHWIDACILEEQGEYDNTVCMQGFAAECALKKILEKIVDETEKAIKNIRAYRHFGDVLFQDIAMMLSSGVGLADVIDPASVLRLSQIQLPQILFQDHPERRYFKDGIYQAADASACREAAEKLIREMVRMRLDGHI